MRDDLRPSRAVIWASIVSAIGWAILILLLVYLPRADAGITATEPGQVQAGPDVLLIERTYDGPVERAGALNDYQYTNGHMLIEWTDTSGDGVFRSGFEAFIP